MPDKKNIEDIFALTPMQEGMLVHYLHDIDSALHFEQLGLKITGDIDIEIFKNAWNPVIAANEMLRAVFRWEKLQTPLQVILKEHPLVYEYYDFSRLPAHESGKKLAQIKKKDKEKKFNLKDVPFRVTLCKRKELDFEMIISFHHIILDGWSTGIILAEFLRAYHNLYLGENAAIPVKTKFKEFVRWVQIQEQNKPQMPQNAYLKDSARTARSPGYFHLELPGETVNKWQNFVNRQKITLAALLYTAWGLLWQKYNRCEDIIFDITVSGRPAEIKGVEHIAGLFINTLPLRLKFLPGEKVIQLLKKIRDILKDPGQITNSTVNEYCPANQRFIFDCLMVIENYAAVDLVRSDKDPILSITSFSIEEMTRYDLTFIITAFNGFEFHLTYTRDLFDESRIAALVNYFLRILDDIIADPGITAADIKILPAGRWIDYAVDKSNRLIGGGPVRGLPGGSGTLAGQSNNQSSEKIPAVPGCQVQEKLRQTWSEILNIDVRCIDVDTSFFEFSGHSLKVKILAARIQEDFKVKVPLEKIFQFPDIKGMAAFIISQVNRVPGSAYYSPPVPLEKKEYYELSSAQKRFFMLHRMNEKENAAAFNMPGIYILEGELDRKRLELSFHHLVQRHESLRTSFHVIDGQPVQRVHPVVKLNIEYSQCTAEKTKEKIKEFVKPFNLEQAPLFRPALIKTGEPGEPDSEKHFLLLDIHHIISDGFSISIILREFTAGCRDRFPGTPGIQYKDYAAWHNKLTRQDLIANEKYWSEKLTGYLFTQVPADNLKSYQSVTGRSMRKEILLPMCRQINRYCNEHRVTRFVFLLSLFFIVLEMESGQQDITIASPIADRDHKALQNVIGVFLNVLLIRAVMNKNMTFNDYVTTMKENFIEALEHGLYPYEGLKDRAGISRQRKQGELFSILFNYFVIDEEPGDPHCPFKIESVDAREAIPVIPKYDLTLYVTDSPKSVVLDLVYKANLYQEYRVNRIMENFIDLIPRVLEHPGLKLSDLWITDSRFLGELQPDAEALFDNDDLL